MADVVSLNVGGTIYTTSRATLTRFPDTMLGSMFSDRLPSIKDDKGNYLIDGDGPLFRYVLNFLRRSILVLPEDFKEFDMLAQEADYYQIKELIDAVTQIRNKVTIDREEVSLNVGGTTYTTSRATLTRFPDTMLGSMFSDRLPSIKDDKGNYLIDGDGPLFRYVLNFLRRSILVLPEDFKELDMLAQEADYYQIKELIEAVARAKSEHVKEQEALEVEDLNGDYWANDIPECLEGWANY